MKQLNVFILSFGEAWDRFSYYGLQATLVLYLTHSFLYDKTISYSVYGVYATLGFSTPVLGGYLADHFLGELTAARLGCLLIILGNLLLLSSNLQINFSGIALCVLGTCLFKPSATSLVGKSLDHQPTQKTVAYTIFYVFMNAGAVLGPLCFGVLIKYFGWHAGFLASATGFTLTLIIFALNRKQFEPDELQKKSWRKAWLYCLSIAALCYGLLSIPTLLGAFIILLIIAVLLFLAHLIKTHPNDKHNIIKVAVYTFWGIFYFCASFQLGSSVTFFLQSYVNRSVFNWVVPTASFSALCPFFIILSAPLITMVWMKLAQKNKEPNISQKISFGLLFATCSFLLFSLSAFFANKMPSSHASLIILIIANFVLGLGELCIMPTLMTAISLSIAKNLQSTLMGILFLSLGIAGYFASLLAKLSIPNQRIANAISYQHAFLYVSAIILTALIVKTIYERRLSNVP